MKKKIKEHTKKKPKPRSGRTDKKKQHPKFTAGEITGENIDLFLNVFPENHRLFAMEYTRTWNARAAYQKIFPNAKETTAKSNGHKLLQDKKVQLYLDWLAYQKNLRYEITKDDLMRQLAVVTDQSLAAVPLLDKKGNPTGQYIFNAAGANRSIELQGKELGMFVNKVQVDDSKSTQFIVHYHVVPEIKPVDMADPKFEEEITDAVKKYIIERKKAQ